MMPATSNHIKNDIGHIKVLPAFSLSSEGLCLRPRHTLRNHLSNHPNETSEEPLRGKESSAELQMLDDELWPMKTPTQSPITAPHPTSGTM